MNRHTDQPIRKPLDHAERGIRTYFDDLDRAAVDTLEKRFGNLVPEERLQAMRDLPTRFDDRTGFEVSFKKETGERPEKGVSGFCERTDGRAHISTEDTDTIPEIVMHERVHQLGDPAAERIFGDKLYEGVTEDIALDAAQLDPEHWPAQGYPEKRARAAELRQACGSDAIEKAYFQGDATAMRQNLERRMNELADVKPTASKPTA